MKHSCKILIVLLLIAALLAGCAGEGSPTQQTGGSGLTGRYEGAGFASGEEVLLTALSAIRSGDYAALVSCYPVETFLANYRFDDFYACESYNVHASGKQYQTEDDPFGMALTRRAHLAAVLSDAAQPFILAANGGFAAQLQSDGAETARIHFGMVYGGSLSERGIQLDTYLQQLRSGEAERVFSTLRTTGGAFSITDGILSKLQAEGRQELYEKRRGYLEQDAAQIGADEYAEYAVPVNVDGFDCYFTVRAVRYGGRWYLWRLGSDYADLYTMMGGFTADPGSVEIPTGTAPAALPQPAAGYLPELQISGAGFASPEAAADAYTEALRTLDVDGAIACYAVDRMAAQDLQMTGISEWRLYEDPIGGGTQLEIAARATLADGFLRRLLRAYQTVYGRAFDGMWYESMEGYDFSGKDIFTDRPQKYPNALSRLHEMLNDADTRAALQGMQVTSSVTAREELMQERAAQLGASDYCYVLREVQVGGTPMLLCVEAACFDGVWYVMPAWYYSVYTEGTALPVLFS